MQKIHFSHLLLKNKDRITARNKYPMPDMPKKIVFIKPQIVYIRASILNFHLEELSMKRFFEALKDLGQLREEFPYAVFKSSTKLVFCSGFNETAELCQEHFMANQRFEVTEYIVSGSDSVQVIRIFIAGQNMTAKVLQNRTLYDSRASVEERFKLSLFQSSSTMILSASMNSLKQKAMSLYHWISSSFDKEFIMARLALDFIKSGEKFFFIEAHSCKLGKSVGSKSQASAGISPTITSPHNSSRELISMRTLRITKLEKKNEKMLINKQNTRVDLIRDKDEEENYREEEEKIDKRKFSFDVGIVKRGYTIGGRARDEVKKGLNYELKGLVSSLDEAVKKMEKEKLGNPEIRNEFEEFLQSKNLSLKSESVKNLKLPQLSKPKNSFPESRQSVRLNLRLLNN